MDEKEKKQSGNVGKGLSKFKRYYDCKKCQTFVTIICIAERKQKKRFICQRCAQLINIELAARIGSTV